MIPAERIHLAYCDACGDEICEGDVHEVTRERVKGRLDGSWSTEPRHVTGPTRYTCERCIAGEELVRKGIDA
jgi:hypothetical protein